MGESISKSALKVYHDTLVANGVTTYSEADMHADFDNGMWIGPVWMCAVASMIANLEDQAENGEDEDTRARATTFMESLMALAVRAATRSHKMIELRGGYDKTPFPAPE